MGGGIANFYNSNLIDYIIPKITITQIYPYTHPYATRRHERRGFATHIEPAVNFNCGIELTRTAKKSFVINHAFELGYIGFTSKLKILSSDTITHNFTNFIESSSFKINHSIISLGYKIQPTYRNIFISIGGFVSFEHINCNIQTAELVQYYDYYSNPTGPLQQMNIVKLPAKII
jgi:hypothetical protein